MSAILFVAGVLMVFVPLAMQHLNVFSHSSFSYWWVLSFSSQNKCHDILKNLVDISGKRLGLFFSNALVLWPWFSTGIHYTASTELFTCLSPS